MTTVPDAKSPEQDSRVRQGRAWMLHRERRHAQALQASGKRWNRMVLAGRRYTNSSPHANHATMSLTGLPL
jgi:hypothetical protein